MKKFKFYLIGWLILVSFNALGQELIIKGFVQGGTSQALSYVNIGIKHKGVGTVSDENGKFLLEIEKEHLDDTLTFSYVGYHELHYLIKDIVRKPLISFRLLKKTEKLDQVVVLAKKAKIRRKGTRSHNPFLSSSGHIKGATDMVEYARKIKIDKPSGVLSASIYLRYINVDSLRLRINFYNVKDDMPFKKMNSRNIVKKYVAENGWLKINLRGYNLQFTDNFFVSFEFLPDKNLQWQEGAEYAFSYGAQFTGSYYVRHASLGQWERFKGATLSAFVTLMQ